MSELLDWRSSLSAALRFDNMEKIRKHLEKLEPDRKLSAGQNAFSKEGEVYKTAASRDEYDSACASLAGELFGPAEPEPPSPSVRPESRGSPGQAIGRYEKCHEMGQGITSLVFRSGPHALKVIVETRNVEPHNPKTEGKILELLKPPCIPLLETFYDQEQRFVLVFPLMPLTLADLFDKEEELSRHQVQTIFADIFAALSQIHSFGIVHRDMKPSAILLKSPGGPAYLSDFGTAWHPTMSVVGEPADNKILDIGTGPYRAPEVLFGDKSYGPPVDMWAAGAMLAESCRRPHPKPLFDSPPTHEDGSQLGLILSIFKTMGSPTVETWPEAMKFKTTPFEMYRYFEHRPWTDILPDVRPDFLSLIADLVRYDGNRATAEQALKHNCMDR